MADDAGPAVWERDALDVPVVGLLGTDVGALLDSVSRMVGFAGRECVTEATNGLRGERLRPDEPQHLGEVAPDARPYVFEYLLRTVADLDEAEIRIDREDTERRALDQMTKRVMSHPQPCLGQLPLGDIDACADDPHGLAHVEVNATTPGHPANLATWTNKPELHVEPAIALRIECIFIKLAHACHILAVDARESVFNPRMADAGDAEHTGKLGRVARDRRLWIDLEGADTRGLDRQPEPLLAVSHGGRCMFALGHLRAEHKAWQRRADDEHRHEQERLVLIALVREWAVPRRRSPDGETDEQKCDGSRIARPPAQSCPEQRSHGQEAQRGLPCNHRLGGTEDDQAYCAGHHHEKHCLEQVIALRGPTDLRCPEYDDRCQQKGAREVTHPPGHPDQGELTGPDEAADPQRRYANRRADDCGRPNADECKLRHPAGSGKCLRSSAPSLNQHATYGGLEGVACGDCQRSYKRTRRCSIC